MAYRGALSPVIRPTSDWYDMFDFPSRIFDQHFGVGLTDEDILPTSFNQLYLRPRRQLIRQLSNRANIPSGISDVMNDPNQFRVQLDVSHFAPEELTVKAVDGNTIVIEGNHQEKQDEHGYVSRQFTRKYILPKDCEADKIVSSLTPEGILVVTAPKKIAIEPPKPNEKVIPIATGAPFQPVPVVTQIPVAQAPAAPQPPSPQPAAPQPPGP